MAIGTNEIFERGGRDLIDLLEHCVLSVNMDALLLYLIREYRFQPRASGAIALHDLFCADGAPARISEITVIPPKEMRLERTIAALRQPPQSPNSENPNGSESGDQDAGRPPVGLPPRYLFDPIANQLTSGPDTKVAQLEQCYDPDLTPVENLPGGALTAGQRAFVNNLWTPIVRPHLVSAGFWRVATVA